MSTATDAMDTATGQMAAARAAVVSEEQANATALSAAIGQNTQLASDKVGLQGQLATAQQTIAKLQTAVPAASTPSGIVTKTTLTLPDNLTITNLNVSGPVFNAAQQYALVIGSKTIINGGSANSDSGGAHIQGDGNVINDLVTNGCGQNGQGGKATNTTLNRPVSHGNNTKNYPAYNEGGGGKWAGAVNLTVNDADYNGNFGVGFWCDSGCNGVTINGGRFAGSTVTGPNANDQVECFRFELSHNLKINSAYFECAKGQNTVIGICDSDHISITNSEIHGQIGFTQTSRPVTIATVNITGNNIYGSLWWGATPAATTLDGNTYHGKPTDFLLFINKVGHTFADLQKMGYELHGKLASP